MVRYERRIFFELLKRNKAVNSEVSCWQLQKVSEVLQGKCLALINIGKIVLHQENISSTTHINSETEGSYWSEFGKFYCIHPVLQTFQKKSRKKETVRRIYHSEMTRKWKISLKTFSQVSLQKRNYEAHWEVE